MKLTKYNRLEDLDHSWFILFWGVSNFIQYKMYQLQYEGGKKRWHEGVRQVPNFKGFNHQLNIANSHLGLNCFKIGFFFKASRSGPRLRYGEPRRCDRTLLGSSDPVGYLRQNSKLVRVCTSKAFGWVSRAFISGKHAFTFSNIN